MLQYFLNKRINDYDISKELREPVTESVWEVGAFQAMGTV